MILPATRPPWMLRAIAPFEIAKGLLALGAALGLLSLGHTDIHAVTDAFLRHHGIDPERHYTRWFIESVAKATDHGTGQLVCFVCAYAVIRLAEGCGLWWGQHWAEWFAVASAGLYLPVELVHYARHPTLFNGSVIVFNLALVFYLARLLVAQRRLRRAQRAPRADGPGQHEKC
jgi:uncharacterized membrane protein (DUF2068 family)